MTKKQIRKLRRKIQHYVLIDTRTTTIYCMYGLSIEDAYKRLYRKKLNKSIYPEFILDKGYGGGPTKFIITSIEGRELSEWW